MTVRPLIHAVDPYKNFIPLAGDATPKGWTDHAEHFNRLAKGAKLIVEIGSWLGKSAISLCEAAPEAEIVCIDTWLGAREMWTNHDDKSRYGTLRLQNGYPTLYRQFLTNIVKAGKQDQVTPMPMPSTIGLRILREAGIQPDLIYIDGSHDFKDVISDINDSLALNPKVICGDDYSDVWPEVKEAVDVRFRSANTDKDFWWVEL